MAIQTGRPSANAQTTKRRPHGEYVEFARELIELAQDAETAEEWGLLESVAGPNGKPADEKVVTQFCRSVMAGSRKGFQPQGAFAAKYEPDTLQVWVRCEDPAAALAYEPKRGQAATANTDESDNVEGSEYE